MDEEQNNQTQYTYDTPINIIKKEGDFFRNLTSQTAQKPLWLRICIVLFVLLILILPGITFIVLSVVTLQYFHTPFISRIAGLAMGIFFVALGLTIVNKNIKKSS